MTATLAVDLGGTNMRAALAKGAAGALVGVENAAAPKSRDEFLSRLRTLVERHGATHLGIGVPGLARGTVMTWIPNLGFLDGLDLAEALPGLRIGLGNDAQLALLAEAGQGAAKGRRDAVLLSIGTGIGSAVLAGGRIVRGSHGGACSFGWACADPADAGSDRNGWIERQASGSALDAVAQEIGVDDARALLGAARAGDARATEALRTAMAALGTTLAGAVGLLDPEVIVVAGGLAAEMEMLAPMIAAALDRQLPPHLRNIPIRAGAFGPRAGLIGAAIAGLQGPDWGGIDG